MYKILNVTASKYVGIGVMDSITRMNKIITAWDNKAKAVRILNRLFTPTDHYLYHYLMDSPTRYSRLLACDYTKSEYVILTASGKYEHI